LLIAAVGHQVMFPLYGRLARTDRNHHDVVALMHAGLNGVAGCLVAGAIAVGPALIWCVYDDRYVPAGYYLQGLGVAAWFTVLQTGSEVLLLSRGQTRQIASGQFVKLVLLVPLLLGGYHWGGIAGFIAGYAAAEAARYVVLSVAVVRAGFAFYRSDLILTAIVAATVAATFACSPWLALVPVHWQRVDHDRALGRGTRRLVASARP
jgi:O-antigen/teichoic acid export membrane protein